MTRTKAERAARRTWNRCDVCKQFISMLSLENGTAIRRIITPDSAYTSEQYETLCPKHAVLGEAMPKTKKPIKRRSKPVHSEPIAICKCGKYPATEPHSCPYASDIGDNWDEDYCTCCDECYTDCVQSI